MNQTYLSLLSEPRAIQHQHIAAPVIFLQTQLLYWRANFVMIAKYLLVVSVLTGLCLSDKFTLPANYSVEVLPTTEDDTPVELLASVNLRNILDVLETKQQIREGGER